ncbi:hypothetical protein Y032_0084g1704 [Ancylostoma ceylanicum]|nr:hypothetical protein Y032_0084g1704 [Ancylostoma ceylanicum]
MPHHYFSPLQNRSRGWPDSWEQARDGPQQSRPNVSLFEMLLYVLDHRTANEAARNFHIRQATKSRDMAPVERKAKRGRVSADSKNR